MSRGSEPGNLKRVAVRSPDMESSGKGGLEGGDQWLSGFSSGWRGLMPMAPYIWGI